MTDESTAPQPEQRRRLSPELVAILTVGVALAGLLVGLAGLVVTGQQRLETRLLASEAAWQAESRQIRETARADRESFQREIIRLTAGQAELAALVKQ